MPLGRFARIIVVTAMVCATAVAGVGMAVASQADAASRYSTTANLNVRSAPSLSASILATLPNGTPVTSNGSASNGWLPISYNGGQAYVSSAYVTTGSATTAATTATTTVNVNFRTQPTLTSSVITVLRSGTTVTTTGTSGDFTAVSANGTQGWVWTGYLSGRKAPATTLSAVSTTEYTTAIHVRVRTQPSLQSATITMLAIGTKLTVTGAPVNGFAPISYKGVARWISASYLSTTAPAPAKAPASSATPTPAAPSPTSTAADSSSSSSAPLNLANEAMWVKIAQCESGNRWDINTGNGYFGGLQFSLGTWNSVGGQDFATRPDLATKDQQITVANRLYAQRGLQPWTCRTAVQ